MLILQLLGMVRKFEKLHNINVKTFYVQLLIKISLDKKMIFQIRKICVSAI